MHRAENNLLAALHNWATGQDENFTTDSFVHLLNHLIQSDPNAAILVLSRLSDSNIQMEEPDIKKLTIESQVQTDYGIPDIVIKSDRLIWVIEVKVEHKVDLDQLRRYRQYIESKEYEVKFLTLITRRPFSAASLEYNPDSFFRWHNLVDWFDEINVEDVVSEYLVEQFVWFLKYKGIAMERVGWELIEGVKSFESLINMIVECLTNLEIPLTMTYGSKGWHGCQLARFEGYVGIYLYEPNLVYFETQINLNGKNPDNLKFGEVNQDGNWMRILNLAAEEVHFFARTKASQLRYLESFINESYNYCKELSNS